MESSFGNGAEWVASGLVSSRLGHAALLQLLFKKKLITPEEYLSELYQIVSDDFAYSVREFVCQSERQLRDGPWHIGGAKATDRLGRRLNLCPEDKVLDVGCGIGGPMRQLVETFGSQVVGVDIRIERIVEAVLRTTALGLNAYASFHVAEGERLPFEDDTFDAVISQGTWSHVPDKSGLAREAFRVLKSGGRLGLEFEVLADNAPEGRETLTELLRIAEWRKLIQAVGFEDVEVEEMWKETRSFYPSGIEREQIDHNERVNMRTITRKP